jgi:hypothetical protein
MNAKQAMRKVRSWLKGQIVQEVPEDVALCEFDCRKGQCRMGEWESCERRLKDLQDFRRWKTRKSDSGQLSLSKDKAKKAVSNGGTGKHQGDPEAPLLSTVTGDRPKPGRRPANPAHDPGTGKRQGDAEGRLLRRVAAKTKAKQ